ncbi:hypothetical protein ACFL38_04135 [Candidatus Omnitrophota bacterium]
MSIILDALKKTQKRLTSPMNIVGNNVAAPTTRSLWAWFFSGFITLGLIACGVALFLLMHNPTLPKTILVKQQNVESLPIETDTTPSKAVIKFNKPVLNGIFATEEGYFALINDRIVKVGDYIDGMEILSIVKDEVMLDFKGEAISLRL